MDNHATVTQPTATTESAPTETARHGSLPLDWEHLARATAHPLRVSILEILGMDGGRTLSPSELSQSCRSPSATPTTTSPSWPKPSLIELARQRQVRGATEHFYRIPEAAQAGSRLREVQARGPEPVETTPARAA